MRHNGIFKLIPSVDELLESNQGKSLTDEFGRKLVKKELNSVLDDLRIKIFSGSVDKDSLDKILTGLCFSVRNSIAQSLSPTLVKMINATGIIVHTNMGRAVLSEKAVKNIIETAGGYTNLEFDIESGKRGFRNHHIEEIIKKLFNVESAHVVNNNAAAVLLILNTLAEGKEVICSRGEMIEIGGSFRIPDVIRKSGCILKEVGTTNKTKPSDYSDAINNNTGAILKVHPSNYRVVGFTQETSLGEAVEIGNKVGIPVIYDMGSGNILNLDFLGEPTIEDELLKSPDALCFSGDKLLGGPQAGIILGKKKFLDLVKKNPLSRALRVDKLIISALQGTLDSILREKYLEVPVWKMLLQTKEEISVRAETFINKARKAVADCEFSLLPGASKVGGGAAPEKEIPTVLIAVAKNGYSPDNIVTELRKNRPPVIVRIQDDNVLLDLRTVAENEEDQIIGALTKI